jgi:predicted aspartyl protease
MMEGVVNLRREATMTVVVGNSNRQLQAIDTVIDTGFNGFLSLPSTIIATLNLPWSGSDFVTLGDGLSGAENFEKARRIRRQSL